MKLISVQQIDKTELEQLVMDSVFKAISKEKEDSFEKQTFNVKETAGILKRSEAYVRKMIGQGILKTTAEGKFVTGKEINKYLGNDE